MKKSIFPKIIALTIAFVFVISGVLIVSRDTALANFVTNAWQGYKLTQGLVGYWSFDGQDVDISQVTAEISDRSGNGNNGDWINHATTTAIGKIGQAISFDGTNDYISIANESNFDFTSNFSVSAWVQTSSSSYNAVVGKYTSAPSGWDLGVGDGSDSGEPRMTVRGSSSIDTGSSATRRVDDGKWHLVTAVVTPTAITLYIDGTFDVTVSGTWTPTTNNNAVRIGNRQAGEDSATFPGIIDDVRIYNRVLSADEAKRLYLMGASLKTNVSHRDELTQGLVGEWTFDGQDIDTSLVTAEIRDRSGSGNNGDWLNHATTTAVGKIGQAINFDGSDDYINAGNNSSLQLTTVFTLSAWIKTNNTIVDEYRTIIDKGTASTNRTYWLELDVTTGLLTLRFSVAGVGKVFTSTVALNDTKWHHVVATYDGSFVRIYSDGESVMTPAAQSGSTDNPAVDMLIGRSSVAGLPRYFNGSIDDVRIYNRVLSADEAKRLYLMGASLKTNVTHRDELTTGLVGLWTFDGQDIDTSLVTAEIRDGSGNSKHGDWINHATTTVIGKIGQAINFDGTDDYVNMSGDIAGTGAVTICAWINPRSSGGGGDGQVVGTTAGSTRLRMTSNGIYFSSDGGGTTISTSVTYNVWTYICAARDSTGVSGVIYKNGIQANTGSTGTPAANGADTQIGNRTSLSRAFDGKIDDVRIYNRALSADEVNRLYLMGK